MQKMILAEKVESTVVVCSAAMSYLRHVQAVVVFMKYVRENVSFELKQQLYHSFNDIISYKA